MIRYIIESRLKRTTGSAVEVSKNEWRQLCAENCIVFVSNTPHAQTPAGTVPIQITKEVKNDDIFL